ncbi:MAG: hypothetical protein RR847_00675 [Bacilli bacterium]
MNDKARVIDDALQDTVNKYYLKVKSNKKLTNLYIKLLSSVIEGNYACITSYGNARNNMEQLGHMVIIMELMKNIIKVNSFYNSDDDYIPLKTNKCLKDNNLSVSEIEFLIYKEILRNKSDDVFDLLKKNKFILLACIISFVDARYNEKTKIKNLDIVRDYNDLMLLSQLNRSQDQLMV